MNGNDVKSKNLWWRWYKILPIREQYCVQLLVENREENQWRFLFLGKDIKVRKRAEKMAKFLLWNDNIIKKSLSTQPFAALAWLGLSILLPVRSPIFQKLHCAGIPWLLGTGTTQHKAVLDDFTSISHLQLFSSFYKQNLDSFRSTIFQNPFRKAAELYSLIFESQAMVMCHLSSLQPSRDRQKLEDDWVG
ncbi:hypothetical protein K4K56_000580 [Colletotrichum sp. SAR 10_98]|nr:hypothetical protein K4K55_000675 [Colletotrichum sp. SAR 10_96]KAI8277459.1 hypothetical protein K4K56_000580 [Colletotrichum sp. SAR 10_98]